MSEVKRESEIEMLKAIDNYAKAQGSELSAYQRLQWFCEKRVKENLRRSFKPGDKVRFVTNEGTTIYCQVKKINKKSVGVTEAVRTWSGWNVSPQLLESVSDEEYAKVEAKLQKEVNTEFNYTPKIIFPEKSK